MRFNDLLLEKLEPIFKKYNIRIVEQFENYIKFKSDNIIIVISHDKKENTNSLFIGKSDSYLNQLDEFILKNSFNSVLKINQVTQDVFVDNFAVFFEGKGKILLEGNEFALSAIEKSASHENREYTAQLINKQNLKDIDKAWDEKKYAEFIRMLDSFDRTMLPASYDIKYKIALQKSSGL